jgi:hypothetical protein
MYCTIDSLLYYVLLRHCNLSLYNNVLLYTLILYYCIVLYYTIKNSLAVFTSAWLVSVQDSRLFKGPIRIRFQPDCNIFKF